MDRTAAHSEIKVGDDPSIIAVGTVHRNAFKCTITVNNIL